MNWRFAHALLFFALVVRASNGLAAADTFDVTKSKVTLPVGNGITAEVFQPATQRHHPAVIVLHGAGGTLLDGPEMRRVARRVAASGHSVYLLHYFESTGTLFARDASMQKNYSAWLETVRGSIVAVQQLRSDDSRVGVYGYSLGGFLALQAASDNPRVGAVVEHAGGVWNGKFDRLGKLPPVLMIHGEQDARVPFEKYAKPLIPFLRLHAARLATRFFPAEAHVFTAGAMEEVREAAVQFFGRELAPPSRR